MINDMNPTPAEADRMLQEAGAYAPRDDRERQILAENVRKIEEAETRRMREAGLRALVGQALPCPFCGGKASRRSENLGDRFAYAYEVTYACRSCGASLSVRGYTDKPGYADNSTVEERALAAWNKAVRDAR